jgi:hypothetical protein
MQPLTTVSFDTGAHNRLAEQGSYAESILAAIKRTFLFRLVGLSYEELFSTPNASLRLVFVEHCRKLQEGPCDCLSPHYELLKLLINAHRNNPEQFRWSTIDVKSHELDHEVRFGETVIDDKLSDDQRLQQKQVLKDYKQMWVDLRTQLEPAFVARGNMRPTSFKEAFATYGSQALSAMGKRLYDGGLKRIAADSGSVCEFDTDVHLVTRFIDACPPFRAFLCSLLMSWYHHSARDKSLGERFAAGRNDLFMSVYLPYCDIFVTAEKQREQERCLKEIADVLALKTKIVSYDEFMAVMGLPSHFCFASR